MPLEIIARCDTCGHTRKTGQPNVWLATAELAKHKWMVMKNGQVFCSPGCKHWLDRKTQKHEAAAQDQHNAR